MRRGSACLTLVALALVVTGCVPLNDLTGPEPPAPGQVAEVRWNSIPPADPKSATVSDTAMIDAIVRSWAISKGGWWAAKGRELLPLYRIDLQDKAGATSTYWLGTNSYPARFPCYALCSGWWVAPSSAGGTIDNSRLKGLTSTTYFDLLHNLGIP